MKKSSFPMGNSDRLIALELFTSLKIKHAIEELGIELISHADLK